MFKYSNQSMVVFYRLDDTGKDVLDAGTIIRRHYQDFINEKGVPEEEIVYEIAFKGGNVREQNIVRDITMAALGLGDNNDA
jgi:hypothetical protein